MLFLWKLVPEVVRIVFRYFEGGFDSGISHWNPIPGFCRLRGGGFRGLFALLGDGIGGRLLG